MVGLHILRLLIEPAQLLNVSYYKLVVKIHMKVNSLLWDLILGICIRNQITFTVILTSFVFNAKTNLKLLVLIINR